VRRLAGRDRLRREHLLRERPDERVHLLEERFFFGQPRAISSTGSVPRRRGSESRPLVAERGAHALEFAAREAVGEGEDRRAVDADDPRVALLDDLLEHQPLLVTPQLRLLPRPTSPAAFLVERRASKTPPCDVPPSAIRSIQSARPAPPWPRTCRRTRRSSAAAPRRSAGADSALKIGSSLYSRIGTTHMSKPCWRMSTGRNVSSRFWSHCCCRRPARAACRTVGWAIAQAAGPAVMKSISVTRQNGDGVWS
jgi:hypothetical protein